MGGLPGRAQPPDRQHLATAGVLNQQRKRCVHRHCGEEEAQHGTGWASTCLPVSSARPAIRNRGAATARTAARARLRSALAKHKRDEDREAHRFGRLLGLEQAFTVIYWDQRGCGRSLRVREDPGRRQPGGDRCPLPVVQPG